uniref:Uncharacterized protein n=1 Tax=Quercus lobata TaxID=97700 RepID=A0A7N2N6H7_QUELO
MRCIYVHNMFILLYLLSIIVNGPTSGYSHMVDSKVLNVGEELWKETLPLQTGLRLYQLQGLKPYTWYEVKISYPASIPATFSIQLKRDDSDLTLNHNRRLLNTEKLIFKTESLDSLSNQGRISVLVTVEPEGIVAIPHVQERQSIIFNIALDVGVADLTYVLGIWCKAKGWHGWQLEVGSLGYRWILVDKHMCDLTALGITNKFFVHFTCSQMNVPRAFSFPLVLFVFPVCDELFLGIPHKAWWVVVLVLLCLGLAFIIPSFLPSYLLQKSQSPRSVNHNVSKVS